MSLTEALPQGITKQELLAELERHRELDSLKQGIYFENGKGCAVGCFLESISRLKGLDIELGNHSLYPELLGLPEWFAEIRDTIFEGLSIEESKLFPERSVKAIKEESDLNEIKNEFLAKLVETTFKDYDNKKHQYLKDSQKLVINGLRSNDNVMIKAGRDAVLKYRFYYAVDAYAYADAPTDARDYAADADFAARYGRYKEISDILIELLGATSK